MDGGALGNKPFDAGNAWGWLSCVLGLGQLSKAQLGTWPLA